MSEADGLAKLTQFLNQTKRQAEMAIDCLNTKIKELEERNEETKNVAERFMDERDYYKNYAEQLQLENSKKWRLQERDDWKALVDSVQRDRGRLQEECNRMESELADAYSEIENLRAAVFESTSPAAVHFINEPSPSRSDENTSVYLLSPHSPQSPRKLVPSSSLPSSYIASASASGSTAVHNDSCGMVTPNNSDSTIDTGGKCTVDNESSPIDVILMERNISDGSEPLLGLEIDIPSTPPIPPASPLGSIFHMENSGANGCSHYSVDDTLALSAPSSPANHLTINGSWPVSAQSSSSSPSARPVSEGTATAVARGTITLGHDACGIIEEQTCGRAVQRAASSTDHICSPALMSPTNTVRDLRLELADVIAELEITKRSADAGKYELEEEISHLQEELAEWTSKLSRCPSCGFDLAGYVVSIQKTGFGKNPSNQSGSAGVHVQAFGVAPVLSGAGSGVKSMPLSHASAVNKSAWSPFSLFGYFFSTSSFSGTESTAIQRV